MENNLILDNYDNYSREELIEVVFNLKNNFNKFRSAFIYKEEDMGAVRLEIEKLQDERAMLIADLNNQEAKIQELIEINRKQLEDAYMLVGKTVDRLLS